jgi:nicotinate phosphoribosyltransferase
MRTEGGLRGNMSMLCDFYEFTMSNGFFMSNMRDRVAYFDMFFRKVPDGGGFAIMAGLEQAIEYINGIKFTENDIEYLRSKKIFDEKFLAYLSDFKFNCDVWAVPEGTPVFKNEPIVSVRGSIIEAQLLETVLLLTINHQSLIATKTNRIVRAAAGRDVMEFGARRAQGMDAANYGARASYIAGCASTSNTIVDREYGVPTSGTMAHSWVQMFESEYEAFREYARIYPGNCVLLVDTYNVLKSGMPNAIRVFDEVVVPAGFRPAGIRLDSGDITYLSIKARKMLDEAGYHDCKIIASNSLDEYVIRDMLLQGATVDVFGVGERLITSKSDPVFGGVYKLVAVEDDKGQIIPKIKISENVSKITTPHFKKVYRLFSRDNDKAIADVITLHDEVIDDTKPYEIFDPDFTWKRKTIENFYAAPLMTKIYDKGRQVYSPPDIHSVRRYCLSEVDKLWDEVKRFENPHNYYVDLSQKLWDVKEGLLKESSR